MKIAVAFAVIIGSSALAAPGTDLKERTKKSAPYPGAGAPSYGGASYGAASYGPPCAGAPIALYLAPQGAPHYREDDIPEEHSEHARSYDGSASYGASGLAAAGLAGSGLALSSGGAGAGGAIGYFPHGKIGPCGVPLLLSCSPKVVAGHLAHAHPTYSAPSYKQTEKQEETTELKEALEKGWSDAERGASSPVGHHHHLITMDDHHKTEQHAHPVLSA